jgi:hypothetical protein
MCRIYNTVSYAMARTEEVTAVTGNARSERCSFLASVGLQHRVPAWATTTYGTLMRVGSVAVLYHVLQSCRAAISPFSKVLLSPLTWFDVVD